MYMNGTTDYIEIYCCQYTGSSQNLYGFSYDTYFQAALLQNSYNVSQQVADLTNTTSDYLLQVGETAKVIYTNATTVPLHIASNSGIFELSIFY